MSIFEQFQGKSAIEIDQIISNYISEAKKSQSDSAIHIQSSTRVSLLHIACQNGLLETAKQLILIGHPWNIVDNNNVSAAEYALDAGFVDIYEFLVEEGVRTEFILQQLDICNSRDSNVTNDSDFEFTVKSRESCFEFQNERDSSLKETGDENQQETQATMDELNSKNKDKLNNLQIDQHAFNVVHVQQNVQSNMEYLESKLEFKENVLVDAEMNAVMMGWETPIMDLHSKVLCHKQDLKVLNIGFGLGIIDTLLQKHKPKRHVIVEAHPDVYKKMIQDGWDKISGVQIVFGRWQDVIEQVGCFDAVFYDTFGECYTDQRQFHEYLPNLLVDEHAVYSFFNGLAGTNPFFHDVSIRLAELDLAEIGLTTEYTRVPVEELGDDVWRNLARPYYSLPYYDLPVCKLN